MEGIDKWFVSWDAYYKGSDQLTISKCGSEIFSVSKGTSAENVHDYILEQLHHRDSRFIFLIRSLNMV